MESSNFVMGLISIFIGAAIILAVGTQILGNVQTSTNCNSLPGYNSTGLVNGTGPFGSFTSPTAHGPVAGDYKYSGWSLSCLSNNTQAQSGYSLILVILIVVAAVAILAVVRLL